MTHATRVLEAADAGQFDLEAIVAALSDSFDVVTGTKHKVRRVRLDTFDRRLRAATLTLEHQTVASGERLVLGQPEGSLAVAVPAKTLRWPAQAYALPPGPVRDAIAPVAGIRALMVISDERRIMQGLELHNEDGKTVARLELDEPAAATAASVAPPQLTMHTLRGYEKEARRAARLLTGLGLRAVKPCEDREPDAAPLAVATDRTAPAVELLSKSLSSYRVAMRENLPGLLDDVDTEFLHDFRVAVRRTRATLKFGRPCLPEEMRSRWEPAFKWLGDLTTPVRDLDVYELNLPTMHGWLVSADPKVLEPFAKHLRKHRTAQRRTLVRGLSSARFQQLMMEWEEELVQLANTAEVADREHLSAGELADRGISRTYRRVVRGGAAISPESPAEDLHRLRKKCKDLRYALEVCAPVIAKGPRKRAVADLKGLQDVLGRFQDSEVQREALHGFAEEMMADGAPTSAVLAMGVLIGHLDVEQSRARLEFDGVFNDFARPSSRRLMRRLGGGK